MAFPPYTVFFNARSNFKMCVLTLPFVPFHCWVAGVWLCFSALCSFVWKITVTWGGRGKTHRGKILLTVELKSKECFRLWKMASRSLAPDCEHSGLGKGNLEKVRCGEDRDFHIVAKDIHSFFAGLIARGWCTIISAYKLSTLILNSAPSMCVCMSWAEASGMGQNTLELQPNWRQRVWKVS